MEINRQIRNKVKDSNWRAVPYRNGGNPKDTYNEIVNDSFEEVKKLGKSASHCNLYEMYNPRLGDLRRAENYSSLAPTNGMKYNDRHLESDLRPYSPYKTKQGEWLMAKDKLQVPPSSRWGKPKPFADNASLPFPPISRHQYPVPDLPRYENFAIYWGARAKGLKYSDPFLHSRNDVDYGVEESRRYQRLFWAPVFIPSQPTCRHARQIILTAY